LQSDSVSQETSPDISEPSYSSWKQVAGYFDGDGNVGLEVVKRVLRFKLRFVDTWRPQIQSIAIFLARSKIRCGSVGKDGKIGLWQAAYRLDIVEVRSVIRAARAMLPYTVKKHLDLQVVIDYLEGKITGNQALKLFNEEARSGRRRGKIRVQSLPYTRQDGLRMAQLENAKRARAVYAVNVGEETERRIREDHEILGLGHIRLSRKYGCSESVIRRVLGKK